jgi:hypothetical protein
VTWRRGRRRKKLLDELKERRGDSYLKEEALDRKMCRADCGRGMDLSWDRLLNKWHKDEGYIVILQSLPHILSPWNVNFLRLDFVNFSYSLSEILHRTQASIHIQLWMQEGDRTPPVFPYRSIMKKIVNCPLFFHVNMCWRCPSVSWFTIIISLSCFIWILIGPFFWYVLHTGNT